MHESPHPPVTAGAQLRLLLGGHGEVIVRRTSAAVVLGTALLVLLSPEELGSVNRANVGNWGMLSAGAVAWWFARRGWGQWAAALLLGSLVVLEVFNATQVAGVRTPGLLVALPVLVTAAGWLAGWRVALGMALCAAVAVIGLAVVQEQGWLSMGVLRPVRTYAGVLVVGIAVVAVVQYSALRAYQTRMDEVERARARNVALLEGNPVPISTLNAQGQFVDVNAAWLRTFSLLRDTVIGRDSRELGLWQDLAAREHFMRAMRSQDAVIALPAWLVVQQQPRLFHVYAASVGQGLERYYTVTLLDQSDRLAAEAAQHEVQERLEQHVAERTAQLQATVTELRATQGALVQSEKLASLGSMVAGVAHELNTPIGITLTTSSAMHDQVKQIQRALAQDSLRRTELSAFLHLQQEMAQLVESNARKGAELISSFKQVAVDRSSERRRAFVLRDVAEDIRRSLQPSLKGRPLQITVDIAPDLVCEGYPGALGQVLTNLVQNAALHAFADQEAGLIQISAQCSAQERVVLEVRDNGIGMDTATVKRVFDPFFTTRLGQGGSGLGLAIAHNLVVSTLQGSVSVESVPGRGSCFRVEFAQRIAPSATPSQALPDAA